MLELLRIRGLGVIDDAEIELSPGLTVLTGETGAGKTMVVTGLGLLLGGKGDAARVRRGERAALVEGTVLLRPDHPAAERAQDAGGELDDGRLLLARSVSAEGRSRAHVGGRAVPLGVLGELGEDLVAVHGQDDQRRLLRPARQRAALDRFAGDAVAVPLAAWSAAYGRLRAVRREVEDILARGRERAQEADLLRFGLAEVEAVAPQPGEDVELAAEDQRLAHADALRAGAQAAHAALLGDPAAADAVDAVGLVAGARRSLEQVRDHDPALAALGDRLDEVAYLLADVAGDLASYGAGVDADPARLAAVQERRAALGGLTRKYGERVDDVLVWAERASSRLLELDGSDERLAALRAEETGLAQQLGTLAARLSAARAEAGERLAAAVTRELAALAMPHARVVVAVTQVEAAPGADGLDVPSGDAGRRLVPGPTGVDEVALLLAPHPGAAPLPLHRGASGGELSRVMLAVEVVFAGVDPVPTSVFDEVDAGVGGAAAVEVGRRLAALARTSQVLVVTHLPQVAAFADRHLRVVKTDDGSVTRTGVVALDDRARVLELSRMLAGLEGSETAVAHAEELLRSARRRHAGAAPRGG